MQSLLYGELVPWYRLLDPTEDHRDEAEYCSGVLEQAASGRAESLLELGAGAGNNAYFMKARFRSTLTDLSEPMLSISRELNPECEHIAGDMRSLRLGRTFDAVFVHDAVMYITSEPDLVRVAETAFVHTRPGGAALFAPDFVRETFRERTDYHQHDVGSRSLRAIEWSWDPDSADSTFETEFVFALRDGATMRVAHDHHVEGLFSRATWRAVLEGAGFVVEMTKRPLDDGGADEIFSCRRP